MRANRSMWLGLGLVLVLGSVATGVTAAEAQEDEFNREGGYVGLGASGFISGFQGVAGRADYGNTAGFNIRGGYRFNPYLAAEGVYEYGNSFGQSGSGSVGGVDIYEASSLSTNVFTVGPKLILPLWRFQPYLAGGIGLLNANGNLKIQDRNTGESVRGSDSGTGFAGRFGGGIDFFVTPEVSLFVDNAYTIPATGPSELYIYSFGAGGKYNF